MVVREYDYIRGTTALAPERKINVKEQEVKKKKKQVKKEFDWKNNRIKIISSAMIVSILGVASLSIDSYVYKIQKNLSNLEVEMETELAKSEAMKVDLLKVSSLDNISNIAINGLKMTYPDKSSSITIDMSKNYFDHIKDKKETNTKTKLIAKIVNWMN
jgi:hypothetical protein